VGARGSRREADLADGAQWVDSGLLFTTGKRTPLEPRELNENFERIVAKAGLRRVGSRIPRSA